MPMRKRAGGPNGKPGASRGVSKPARVAYIASGECMKGLPLYADLQADGMACGCRACLPSAWCVAKLPNGAVCPRQRCRMFGAAKEHYCFEHYNEIVRKPGMVSVGAVLKEMAGAGVGKGV